MTQLILSLRHFSRPGQTANHSALNHAAHLYTIACECAGQQLDIGPPMSLCMYTNSILNAELYTRKNLTEFLENKYSRNFNDLPLYDVWIFIRQIVQRTGKASDMALGRFSVVQLPKNVYI